MQILHKYEDNPFHIQPEKSSAYPGELSSGAIVIDPFEMSLVISIAAQVVHNSGANAYQQILVELRDLYRIEKPEKLVSVCWRLFSLYKLIQSGALVDWVPPDAVQKQKPLPGCVIFIAATLPLKDSSGFIAQEFSAAVRDCSLNKD